MLGYVFAVGYALVIIATTPTESCAVVLPSLTSFAIGILYLVMSQLVVAAFGLTALALRGLGASVLIPLGVLLCVVPFYLEPYVEEFVVSKYSFTPADAMLGRFVGGSMIFLAGFRIVEMAVGGTPGDAASSGTSWVTYLTSVDAKRGKDGRAFPPKPDAVQQSVQVTIVRVFALGAAWSLLALGGESMHPSAALPWVAASGGPIKIVAERFLDDLVAVAVVWLFLALLLDIAGLLLQLQGQAPIEVFRDPIFGCTSPQDLWGRRWNMQIHTVLKRGCYKPLLSAGLPKSLATPATPLKPRRVIYHSVEASCNVMVDRHRPATFLASAVYHELQFGLAFKQ